MFDEDQEIEALELQRHTELTAFLQFNKDTIENGGDILQLCKYVDMPENHVYVDKEWTDMTPRPDNMRVVAVR